jgi:hypothetical protein
MVIEERGAGGAALGFSLLRAFLPNVASSGDLHPVGFDEGGENELAAFARADDAHIDAIIGA